MDEFGMGSFNLYGYNNTVIPNPINNEYVCGGSSGGSAASVLLNQCVFSIGSDSGGSIRLPAHCCGLFGFKPSYGTLSRHGLISYISSTDTPSLLSSSAEDVETIYSINYLFRSINW
jgi:aspartyl-tRNA(Asn)/glutamyl-tRNA(Gln) amidotransferase subunit A